MENNKNLDIDSCAHLSPADRNHVAVRTTHLIRIRLGIKKTTKTARWIFDQESEATLWRKLLKAAVQIMITKKERKVPNWGGCTEEIGGICANYEDEKGASFYQSGWINGKWFAKKYKKNTKNCKIYPVNQAPQYGIKRKRG